MLISKNQTDTSFHMKINGLDMNRKRLNDKT